MIYIIYIIYNNLKKKEPAWHISPCRHKASWQGTGSWSCQTQTTLCNFLFYVCYISVMFLLYFWIHFYYISIISLLYFCYIFVIFPSTGSGSCQNNAPWISKTATDWLKCIIYIYIYMFILYLFPTFATFPTVVGRLPLNTGFMPEISVDG